ncbi:MAG: preprotein translocase subunit SecG [Gammaproteobacteria bacterium]
MYTFLLVVQVAFSISLIVLILLQHGKGADAGAAFGSGASTTVFGARGAGNFMSRATAVLATLFFANSLLLSTPLIMGDRQAPASIAERRQMPTQPTEAPTSPAVPSDLPDVPTTPAVPMGSDLP